MIRVDVAPVRSSTASVCLISIGVSSCAEILLNAGVSMRVALNMASENLDARTVH
jgi:hypothetical protein